MPNPRRQNQPTPGTWIAVGSMIEHVSDRKADIASFDPASFDQERLKRPDDEQMANARVCAAAKEMLAALKSIEWRADIGVGVGICPECGGWQAVPAMRPLKRHEKPTTFSDVIGHRDGCAVDMAITKAEGVRR